MERPRVLIVDDEPRVLESLRMNLGRAFLIETTTEPAEALRLLKRHQFAVIISDLKMPQMSGVELLNHARSIAPRTSRVLLTGFASLQSAVDAINKGGVFRLLTKPSSPPEVESVVREAVEAHNSAIDQGLVSRHIEQVKRASRVETLAEVVGDSLSRMALQFSAVLFSNSSVLSSEDAEDLRWVEDRLHESSRLLNLMTESESAKGTDVGRALSSQIDLWRRSGRLGSIRLGAKLEEVARVNMREELLEHAVIVLIENAIAALRNQPDPKIRLRLYFCEFMEMVCFEVKNNGPTLPGNVSVHFEPETVATYDHFRGSLSHLNQALEREGGKMGFRQSETGGVAFSVWMPVFDDMTRSMMLSQTEEMQRP